MALLSLDYKVINLTRCEECSAEGAWVKVKSNLSRRDKNHVKGAVIALDVAIGDDGQPIMPESIGVDSARVLNSLDFTILQRALVAWSYADALSEANIERMHDEDIDELKDVLGALYATKDDEEKKATK